MSEMPMSSGIVQQNDSLEPIMSIITWQDFENVDVRVGTIALVEDFPQARKPAYKLTVDFGEELGVKRTSAQITVHYTKEELVGRQVLGVVNFPPKQIGPFMSEFLLTGLYREDGSVILAVPDKTMPSVDENTASQHGSTHCLCFDFASLFLRRCDHSRTNLPMLNSTKYPDATKLPSPVFDKRSVTRRLLASIAACIWFCLVWLVLPPVVSWAQSPGSTHRVLTYNIKRGYGNDGRTDLQRTADVIAKLNPDFVGLQEVDEDCNRSGNVDQAQWLGEHLDMHAAFAPFMDYDGGRYGMAVLSRYPIEKTEAVNLPLGREPRVALAIRVALPDGNKLTLVNVHFDYIRDDTVRFEQATKVREFMQALSNPAILLGDFNDIPESRTVKLFAEGFVEAEKPADDPFTFSAEEPKREIDFLFASPAERWAAKMAKVINEPLASDHRPVLAVLQLQPN